MGVGSARGPKGVRWGVARRILLAWVITIPATMTIAALTWFVLDLLNVG
jgi:PiT family inorganic phosphate transporter